MLRILCFFLIIVKCHSRQIYIDQEDTLIDENSINNEVYNERKIPIIFPGTKWCGTGNISNSENDLGPFTETDACCREHDSCGDVIEARQTKHNLTNPAPYSRLICRCDQAFYNCLKTSTLKSSKIVGNMYFNALDTKCYKKTYPVIRCARQHGFIRKKCTEYEFDTTGDEIWQWFDVPAF